MAFVFELPEVGDFLPCELRYRASSLTEASKALGLRDEAVAESEVIGRPPGASELGFVPEEAVVDPADAPPPARRSTLRPPFPAFFPGEERHVSG